MTQKLTKLTLLAYFIVLLTSLSSAQNYVRRDGKKIVDPQGQNLIIKSIGTGNWMIQEGYMMNTAGVAGTQHEIRERLINSIGETKTDSFYNVWLANGVTRSDIDSMKAWGFNSIRPALHYYWFTPPIEEEPVPGEISWKQKGFDLLDSLMLWCADAEMYVILDLHGAPGGQGNDEAISDYDPSKPSLWESQANKDKTIALWRKIAERYSTNPWIAGYDLLNEPNWGFTEPNNQPLWELYKDITTAIREVDNNHLIIIEGNWFANDYNGLPTLWDENMALSFHKYWTYNDMASIQWMVDLRNQRNVPIWLGETGENSNTWFANLAQLCESNNIGWSWWPVKKPGINNILQVHEPANYNQLIKSWKGEAPAMNADETFQAVLDFAENQKLENCDINYDVIDALIRQPGSFESKPFKDHNIDAPIFFSDYDLGRNNVAYLDMDTANYHLNTQEFTTWNKGWYYRNDGVDLEPATDAYLNNGCQVGFTEDGEWLQYTINVEKEGAYSLSIRSAAQQEASTLRLEANGADILPALSLQKTGSWTNWSTSKFNEVLLNAGENKLRFYLERAHCNLNYFILEFTASSETVAFKQISAETKDKNTIYLTLNKEISEVSNNTIFDDLSIVIDGKAATPLSAKKSTGNARVLEIRVANELLFNQEIKISYSGESISGSSMYLSPFSDLAVKNQLPIHSDVPGKVEAEDYGVNMGFELEDCEDFGEGLNLSYADAGDYSDYLVYVPNSGTFKLDYRIATTANDAELTMATITGGIQTKIDTLKITNTGGWQNWQTQSSEVFLGKGLQTIRIQVKKGPFNLNWFKFTTISLTDVPTNAQGNFQLYPNPASSWVNLKNKLPGNNQPVAIYNTIGKLIKTYNFNNELLRIDTSGYKSGLYFIRIGTNTNLLKLIIANDS